jgi:thiol-disulfide isomerase/thioredoxin
VELARKVLVGCLAASTLAAAVPAAAEDIGCIVSKEWKEQAPAMRRAMSACGKDADCLKPLDAQWQEALRRTPRDMRLYWSYAEAWGPVDRARVGEVFKARLDADPKDPFAATIQGHALADRAEKMAAYRKALEHDPSYGWPHYYLAVQLTGRHASSKEKDDEAAKPHVRAWLAACPSDGSGLRMASGLGDSAFAVEMTKAARRALEGQAGETAVHTYEALWAAEFKAVPASEHDALRDRVRADVARIKKMGLEGDIAFWRALQAAYALTGDKAEKEAAQKEMQVRFPCESATLRARIADWEKAHPRPDYYAEESVRTEHPRARYAFDTELARACPAQTVVAASRLRSARDIGDLPQKEVEAALDDYFAARAKADGSSYVSFGLADPAVELCVNHRTRLEKVTELIQAWRQAPSPPAPAEDAAQSRKDSHKRMLRRTEWDQVWLQARADNLLGRTSERDAGMARLKELQEAADTFDRTTFDGKLAWLRAEIAEADKKPVDAIVFYQQAFAGLRNDRGVIRASREALQRLGASEETLATLTPPKRMRPPVVSRPAPWKDVNLQLPAASLERVGGGKWALVADLEGKRTLVNVWATWCAPCKKELPELQKLYDRVKGRSDVAIVSLNVDDNPGVVAPFLAETKYTFPVVFGSSFWDSLKLESNGIPTNWIVDDKGVARAELRGFGESAGDAWVDAALAKLEGKTEARADATTETRSDPKTEAK